MHIIFGEAQAQELSEKFIVLELDTFRVGDTEQLVTAYCIIEKINFDKMPLVDSWRTTHQEILNNYRGQKWDECLASIESVYDSWGNDVDTFYDELKKRINYFKENDPGPTWDPVIPRYDIELPQ